MNDDRDERLSDSERNALQSLWSQTTPTNDLEDKTVDLLRSHGLIRSRRRVNVMRVSFAVGSLIAVALIFVAGITVGKRSGETTTTAANNPAKQYMLLLYMQANEDVDREVDVNSPAYLAIIDEYRQWGAAMAESGTLVSAEKLKSQAAILSAEGEQIRVDDQLEGRVLGGYFLIEANSLDDARALASTHPHLKYGGEVEIRQLDLHDEH